MRYFFRYFKILLACYLSELIIFSGRINTQEGRAILLHFVSVEMKHVKFSQNPELFTVSMMRFVRSTGFSLLNFQVKNCIYFDHPLR